MENPCISITLAKSAEFEFFGLPIQVIGADVSAAIEISIGQTTDSQASADEGSGAEWRRSYWIAWWLWAVVMIRREHDDPIQNKYAWLVSKQKLWDDSHALPRRIFRRPDMHVHPLSIDAFMRALLMPRKHWEGEGGHFAVVWEATRGDAGMEVPLACHGCFVPTGRLSAAFCGKSAELCRLTSQIDLRMK